MTTVYVLSAGSYSDYRVVAVVSTKAEAERLAAIDENINDPEEFELDPDVFLTYSHRCERGPRWRPAPIEPGMAAYEAAAARFRAAKSDRGSDEYVAAKAALAAARDAKRTAQAAPPTSEIVTQERTSSHIVFAPDSPGPAARIAYHSDDYDRGRVFVVAEGTDRERVQKVARDRFAQLLAEQLEHAEG